MDKNDTTFFVVLGMMTTIILYCTLALWDFDKNQEGEVIEWIEKNHPNSEYVLQNGGGINALEVIITDEDGNYSKYLFWEHGKVELKEEGHTWKLERNTIKES